ncbi:MAG: UDP-N-acetylmuramate:L-alanyl-gamma-D-glutamyl-meso-diaminopimelate ligase [Nitrosomonas sp.]|nr:UDP-N-acetylmuramate:L-alanyl-gamma-D-glutamyl-meso-diaminopimelate ligase [Nitrosomonas sp.]
MHIHILGICGTFMGGIAAIAKESGHRVTGCDQDVYPPMSTQLESLGIELIAGFSEDQISLKPDVFVIGNVVTRGNPLMEAILNQNLPYISGPQWLSENILRNRWVLAVAGTHGKTTTSAILAWILEYAGLHPGFLIGGIPENFDTSARIGLVSSEKLPENTQELSPFFVIEADEYDTAFFDKRSKFVHYRPRVAILNNLEFDHADIFQDLAAIQRQFHHFVRVVPNKGLIVSNGTDANLKQVLDQGCWTPVEPFGVADGWYIKRDEKMNEVFFKQELQGQLQWDLLGEHNRMNALAALAAARYAGVSVEAGIEALSRFRNVKRRLEIRGEVKGVTIYDDFAHHPTAIQTTIDGLREHVGRARILAILEPRSNTMKMGIWKDKLADSLRQADLVFCYSRDADWANSALADLDGKVGCFVDLQALITAVSTQAVTGDHVLIMSNGGFGGIHKKLLETLSK